MKKFKELNMNEQHREKGKFKPTIPHVVPNVATASPRKSSDSAEVRLKEDSMDSSTLESPAGNQFRQGDSPAARSMIEKPQKEPMKKYKEKVNEMLKPKMSALDKFRQAAAERAKKHDNIEKEMQARHAAGKEDMSGSIDRLSKQLNKEEAEMENTIEEGQNKQIEGGDPCWKNYQMVGKKMKNGKEVPNCVPVKEAKDDDVGEMVKDKLKIIISRAQDMHDSIKDNAADMPEWVKSKVTLAQDYISTACDYSCGKEQLGEESEKHPFVAVHAKKGKHETHGSTSYEAAQNAAKHWKMKNTAGIDVYRADKTHVAEEVEQIDELKKSTLSSYIKKATSSGDERSVSNLASRAGYKMGSAVHGDGEDSGSAEDHKSFLRSKSVAKAVDRLTKEEVEQIDEAPVVIKTNKPIGTRVTSIGPGGKETVIKSDPPFEGPYTKVKKTITDKSGAKHSPMSRAKDLARKALSNQSKALKPVKEEKEDSRKAEIVKNVMKSAKKKKSESTGTEKFESNPVLSSDIQKQ